MCEPLHATRSSCAKVIHAKRMRVLSSTPRARCATAGRSALLAQPERAAEAGGHLFGGDRAVPVPIERPEDLVAAAPFLARDQPVAVEVPDRKDPPRGPGDVLTPGERGEPLG